MTLKAFSERYGIDYTLVTEAAIHIFPKPTLERDNDYDENEVFWAVNDCLVKKKAKAEKEVKKYESKIERLTINGFKYHQFRTV